MFQFEAKHIFSVPILSVSLDGLSDKIKLESIIRDEIKINPNADTLNKVLQSYPNLQHKKSVSSLVRHIREGVEVIANQVYQYDSSYEIDITAMWANIQQPGKRFNRHSHHNNIFSGVFYANSDDEFPHIEFFTPVQSQLQPTLKECNIFNSDTWREPCEKDRLLIFPSWLKHEVDINNSDKDRLSISFNVMLRGRYDGIESLQSTVI